MDSEAALPLSTPLGIWQKGGAPCFLDDELMNWLINEPITVESSWHLSPFEPKIGLVNTRMLFLVLPSRLSHWDLFIYFLVKKMQKHSERKYCFPGWDILEVTLSSRDILRYCWKSLTLGALGIFSLVSFLASLPPHLAFFLFNRNNTWVFVICIFSFSVFICGVLKGVSLFWKRQQIGNVPYLLYLLSPKPQM